MEKQIYKTVQDLKEPILFKEKASKFFGYIFKVESEKDVKEKLEWVKKEHYTARHHCYGYQYGVQDFFQRANDDGEPSYSAGKPILNQILANELTNTFIVVVRYFGGVKLGVGGLISAYKTAAQMAIEATKINEIEIQYEIQIDFEYPQMNDVMRILKTIPHEIKNTNLQESCTYTIKVNKALSEQLYQSLKKNYLLKVKYLNV